MEWRPLGRSGLQVTPLGLGLAALGRPGYINLGHGRDLGEAGDAAAMEDHAHGVLDSAWETGIRYYDDARSYGRAEQFLASWLAARGGNPEEVTVGSKWGYIYTAGWRVEAEQHEVKEHSLENLRRQLAESLALLGPYLDLYQIHSATLDSGVLDNRSVLDELARLREGGLVIGLSLSGERQAETLYRALEIEYDGRLLFGAAQATWNLLERSAGQALATAHGEGVGVIVKEALANGRLTPRNDDGAFRPKRALLEGVAAELGTTMDALALAAVLAQPWADVALSGATTVEQLRANVAAVDVPWSDEVAARLDELEEPAEVYWRTRSRLPWN